MKSDFERGPFGAWAFHARDALDLSVEEVASRLGYHPASMRKMESGSAPPSRRMIRELPALYGEIAGEKSVTLPPPPAGEPEGPTDAASAIRELVEEVRLSRLAQERTAAVLVDLIGLVAQGRPLLSESAAEAVAPDRPGRN